MEGTKIQKDWTARGMSVLAASVVMAISAIDPARGAVVATVAIAAALVIGCYLTRRTVFEVGRLVWRHLR